MQIKSKLSGYIAAIIILACAATESKAQSSSINTFSPYTLYGIGDLGALGPVSMRGMGSIGTAYRNPVRINTLNPASYSAIPRQSALFTISLENQNYYLSEGDKRTSYNTFNIRDLALQLPVYKGVGFAFSMTPYSKVGYRISNRISDGMIGSQIGSAEYTFDGSGGITQFKAGLGWAITDYISVGAEAVYYHGKINRDFSALFTAYTTTQTVTNLYGSKIHKINTILGLFGMQSTLSKTETSRLTFGATYRMGGLLRGSVTKQVPTSLLTSSGGNAIYTENDSEFYLADTYTAGFMYERSDKFRAGLDYSFAQWSTNAADVVNNIVYRDTHALNFGVEYTPNAKDIRRYINRISYRAGVRYNQYYMSFNNNDIDEYAFSLGLGLPINSTGSQSIDVGFEFGMRGKNSPGIIKEQFFKFSVGFSLFGGDYWFTKPRYD